MKSIMRFVLLFICLVPACGGRTGDDASIGDPITTTVGGAAVTKMTTGGSAFASTTGGNSSIETSIFPSTGGDSTSEIGGNTSTSTAVMTGGTNTTGGSTSIVGTSTIPTIRVGLEPTNMPSGSCTKGIWEPMYIRLESLNEGQDVTFTAITLTHVGTASISSIAEVVVSNVQSVIAPQSDRVRIAFDRPISIEGGRPYGFTIYAYANGLDGEQHTFQIARPEDVEFKERVITKGTFPAQGVTATFTDDLAECAWLYTSLSSETPPGLIVPKGASSVPLVTIKLPNRNDTAIPNPIHITSLRFNRVGAGSGSDFENVYLLDQENTRLTQGRAIMSDDSIVFNGLDILVQDNASVFVTMVADIALNATTGNKSAFEITSADDVSFTGEASSHGVFPACGNTFTIGSTTAASLEVRKGTTPPDPRIGTHAEISRINLIASTNEMSVDRMTLVQTGSISSDDLSNLELFLGSVKVAQTSKLSGNKIVLNFSEPILIPSNGTQSLSLRADVSGPSGRTIRTSIDYPADVHALDILYETTAHVEMNGADGFDGADPNRFIQITTQN